MKEREGFSWKEISNDGGRAVCNSRWTRNQIYSLLTRLHQMGIPYPMKATGSLTNDDLEDYKKMGEDMGPHIKIGG